MDAALLVPQRDTMEDSSSSGAEGRSRRKFQRTVSENENPLKKFSGTMPPPKPTDKSSFAGRRRSTVREHKTALLGPRPLEYNPSKRIISETATASASSTAANRSFLPTSTNETFFVHAPESSNPRFSFGKAAKKHNGGMNSSDSFDFLPSVSFDDFHSSITSYEPGLSNFPTPRKGGGGAGITTNGEPSRSPTKSIGMAPTRNDSAPQPPIARTPSLIRRLSNARRKTSQQSTADISMPPPSAPLPVRSRRQSQFPVSTSSNAVARAPRKSVGPGLITASFGEGDTRPEALSAAPNIATVNSLSRASSLSKPGRRGTLVAAQSAGPELPRLSTTDRNARTKPLQPSSDHTRAHLTTPSMTPVHGFPASIGSSRSPGKSPGQFNHTPSSSGGKKQNTMPTHVGGLGARTISPTDARRIKRLSIVHNAPAIPHTPTTPQPEHVPTIRPVAHSPGPVARKSTTPSSSRATPEQIRKTVNSVLSVSSGSSFNSLRTSNNVPSSRSSQNISTSRLQTPKARNVHSSAGVELEEVPPVPAIPKAYESPKDQIDQPLFAPRKSSGVDVDEGPGNKSMLDLSIDEHGMPTFEGVGLQPAFDEQRQSKVNPRHRRGLTVGDGSDADKGPAMPNPTRKNLQPLRLPPLNLLPLSSPTATRIASFPAPSAEVDERSATPPPRRGYTKTPSTPMTASKATFFSKGRHDAEDFAMHNMRSSTSHHLRSDPYTFDHCVSVSNMPISIPNDGIRQTTTPFASTSLPKGGGEFSHMRDLIKEDLKPMTVDVDQTMPELIGSKGRMQHKKDSSSAYTSTSDEPETPSSGTSLRRKLSLGWKRSSSKASHVAQPGHSLPAEQASGPQPPKHNDMPPPKLPGSATWTGTATAMPIHTVAPRSSLDSKRRKSSAVTLLGNTGISSESQHVNGYQENAMKRVPSQLPPAYAEQQPAAPRSASSSILTPMHRMLGSKGSTNTLKARNLETKLDKDDLAAEKVMERLTSKRKDVEIAAREVDELRKRATPKERVLPMQAMQMANLNIFERGEIIDYKEVYFCGTKSAKKIVGDTTFTSNNHGYDDDRGDYNIVLGDHLAYRYEVIDVLGKGSFGQVVRCIDHKLGVLVAVKIIRNKKRFHQQALVEVNILQKLREWDPENKHSMINFTQSFYFREHLCISTELLGANLYEFIKAYEFKGFPLVLIRRFTKQMLSALVLLQSKRVIHCDLKPENVLLAHPMHSEIKVIDFGSSCFENEKVYTYIQSRFYRSPEVILGMSYGMPIDMWSLGCILAELLTGYPIFPGENEQEQLACIMEVFGPPEKHLIEKSSRKKLFFDSLGKPRMTVSSKGRRRRPSSKTLQQALKCDDEPFLDFISRCLRWDPDRRLKPDEAVHHEFVTGVKRGAGARVRSQANGGPTTVSPMKRFNTVQTPQRTRPLPEPPATSFKNGAAVPGRDVPSSSPVKAAQASRRHSTMNGLPTTSVGVKRTSNGAAVAAGAASGLPRVAQRSASGKPDMASSAAAIASLRSRV